MVGAGFFSLEKLNRDRQGRFLMMDFKYRWKNGAPPSRDQAAQEGNLLDESQFEHPQDHQIAEEMARKHLNVPLSTADTNLSPLPQAAPPEGEGRGK